MSDQKEDKWEMLREQLPDSSKDFLIMEQICGHCELDHSGDPRGPGPYKAINSLIIPKKSGGFLSLPICGICAGSLAEEKSVWKLFICWNCTSTKWMHESRVRRYYKEQIIGMNNCPNCDGEGK